MLKKHFILLLALCAICVVNSLQAQDEINKEAFKKVVLKDNLEKIKNKRSQVDYSYDQPVRRTIPVTVWLISKIGNPTDSIVTKTEVDTLMARTSKYFAPIGLSFSACKINVLPDPNFRIIYYDTTTHLFSNHNAIYFARGFYMVDSLANNIANLLNTYYDNNTLNLYLTGEIIYYNKETVAGVAPMPSDSVNAPKDTARVNRGRNDHIFLSSYTPHVFAHELGHYFGLFHTHEDCDSVASFEPVKATKEQAMVTGDLIWDTPAEPNLLNAEGCFMSGKVTLTDKNGDYYVPNFGNVMSYGPSCGWDGFTTEQYKRMLWTYYKYRSYLR